MLRIGFFENLNGQDSLVFSGDADGIRLLLGVFADLFQQKEAGINFGQLSGVEIRGNISFVAKIASRSLGMRFAPAGKEPRQLLSFRSRQSLLEKYFAAIKN